jgi:hypothetical protein
MKFNLKKEGIRLVIDVTIDNRPRARSPHTSVRTEQVLDIVKERGYNIDDYVIEKDSACTTEGKNPTLSSTWILREKGTGAIEEPKVKSPKRRRTTKPRSSTTKTKENKLLGNEDLGGVQSQAQINLSGQD